MNIPSKAMATCALALACYIPQISAKVTIDSLTNAEMPMPDASEMDALPIESIDALTINHDGDPGALQIKKLLAQQFSPLRIQLETNANEHVRRQVDKFSGNNYRFHLSKMLGLSGYYFPIFEKAFREIGVPQEIKYLAIIESSLNPQAVSRKGATGPWQFMYMTAKEHGLVIDSYIDERKDPFAASYAAATYLKEAYDQYQDWLLAIASYNCGRGNVNRAIQRSGLPNPSYWDIRHLLPTETKNYIPAFIALYQVLENHEKYDIQPDEISFATRTETIMVDRQVSLTSVADALSIDEETILALNPAYKRKLVQGRENDLKTIIVPLVDKDAYGALYAALQGDPIVRPESQFARLEPSPQVSTEQQALHAIKKGETLEKIALRYQVTVQDLKAWNNLKNHIIIPGQKLKIEEKGKRPSTNSSKEKLYATHKVKKGDTLSAIAKRYKIEDVKTIKAMNNLNSNRLHPGMTLNVSTL